MESAQGGNETTKATTEVPSYTRPDCTLTLREALAEHREKNPGLIDPADCEPDMAAFFESHDAVHVVFGLTTQLGDEAMADTWTLLRVSIKNRDYVEYLRSSTLQELLKSISMKQFFVESLRALPRMFKAMLVSRKVKTWPWQVPADHYDMSLLELRKRYGIELV